MQDLYVWLSGAMFTAVAGFALLRDDHVRVDIFYRPAGRSRRKAIADLIGVVVFLLPFIVVVLIYSPGPMFARSWRLFEGSGKRRRHAGPVRSQDLHHRLLRSWSGSRASPGLARSILVLAGSEDLLPEPLRYKRDPTPDVPL